MNAGLHGHGMDALMRASTFSLRPFRSSTCWEAEKPDSTSNRCQIADAAPYAGRMPIVTWRPLAERFRRSCTARGHAVYEGRWRPVCAVLARMEMAGICVDRDVLSSHVDASRAEDWRGGAENHGACGEEVQRGFARASGRDSL